MVFLGTPEVAGNFLEFLLEKKFKVEAVWTNSPKAKGRGGRKANKPLTSPNRSPAIASPTYSAVSQVAKKNNLPCYEVKSITPADEEKLKVINPRMIFILAFGKILPAPFYSLAKLGAYNLHFSLLPKYRGASPLQSAILNGEAETGITFQKINNKMDAGDIVLQKKFSLKNLTYLEALAKALTISKSYFPEFLEKVKLKKTQPQNHNLASFCFKIKKTEGEIKKETTIKTIVAKYLAFNPWPGIYFIYDENKYNLIKISWEDSALSKLRSSTITIKLLNKRIVLSGPDGSVEIITIQKQGRKALLAKEFLNGCNWSLPITL